MQGDSSSQEGRLPGWKKRNQNRSSANSSSRGGGNDMKPPCRFFTSDGGCRNGTNCNFQHDENRRGRRPSAAAVATSGGGAGSSSAAIRPKTSSTLSGNRPSATTTGSSKRGSRKVPAAGAAVGGARPTIVCGRVASSIIPGAVSAESNQLERNEEKQARKQDQGQLQRRKNVKPTFCQHFLQHGQCKNGNKCRFTHPQASLVARQGLDPTVLHLPHRCVQQLDDEEVEMHIGEDDQAIAERRETQKDGPLAPPTKFGQLQDVILLREAMRGFPVDDLAVSHALLAASPQLRYGFQANVPWSFAQCKGSSSSTDGKENEHPQKATSSANLPRPFVLPCITKEVVNMQTMTIEPQYECALFYPATHAGTLNANALPVDKAEREIPHLHQFFVRSPSSFQAAEQQRRKHTTSCIAAAASLHVFTNAKTLNGLMGLWNTITAVSFSGCQSLTSVGDYCLQECCNLLSVDFSGCSGLTFAGNAWLIHCESLQKASFAGCTSLKKVGFSWLRNCRALTSVDFSGCSALTSVGAWWLLGCDALTSVDFSGCASLVDVGNCWLYENPSLTSVSLACCKKLTSVDDFFLTRCTALTSVDLSGCNALKAVHQEWLQGCGGLKSVDFSQCVSLKTVGAYWLSDCKSLTSVNLSGCSALSQVGDGWLRLCPALKSVDFSGCTSLSVVGQFWLMKCPALTLVDMSGIAATSPLQIGDRWLEGCTALQTIKMTHADDGFLKGYYMKHRLWTKVKAVPTKSSWEKGNVDDGGGV